jgi:hydrophobe/amphiphile efflux-1 (HAE1) family protein
MNLSAPFILRPVATVLLTISIALMGTIAYYRIPTASLPNIERPTISVLSALPGGSADTVSSSLTAPLEHQLGLIPGLKDMHANSVYGKSAITMEFGLDKDIDAAAGAVQAAINAAGPFLPQNMPGPPIYVKANPAGFPILAIALTSDVINSFDVYQYADTVLAGKLSQVEGVGLVAISGAARPGVRIEVNPRALADMNLSTAMVRHSLLFASEDRPKGQIADGARAVTLAANDQLFSAADFRDVVIAWRNGAPVKLTDVAEVFDSTINDETEGWFDGKPAVVLYVLKTPDANIVQTVDAITAMLPQLQQWIPGGITAHVLYERTALIRTELSDVQFTLAVAVLLVVLVLLLFLRRFWLTVIPSISIPVSLAAALAVIYLLGFTLDNISLLALTIAVGFVIDDSVIVIENIARLVQAGASPIEAALTGTRQMGFTVIAIAVALIAGLIPILFMPDIVGRLFREFGLTLVAAVITSAIVSLTLTPMLCARLLKRDAERAEAPLGRISERTLGRCLDLYAGSLDWTLRHRRLMLLIAVALTAGSVDLYLTLPKGFLPTQDTGLLRIRTLSKANISFDAKITSQRAIASAILADPAVEHVASYIGYGAMSVGSMLVKLKAAEVRREPIAQVIERLRGKLAGFKDANVYFVPLQDVQVGAKVAASRYQFTLSGFDRDEVVRWGLLMKQRIAELPQTTEVHTDYENAGVELKLVMNRARAARANVSALDIDNILYDWFGQLRLNLIRFPVNHARVVLEVQPSFRQNQKDLENVFLTSGLPADVMSGRRRDHAPMWIPHQNGIPSLTISFNTAPGLSIGDAVAAIRQVEAALHLPNGITSGFQGEARLADETTNFQPLLFAAAIIAIYLILGILYESSVHPLTILSTLPSAVFGALLSLVIMHAELNIISAVACVLVVGIVLKNAIMMVDFALDAERQMNMPPAQAICQAARQRVRPILMTTLAAIFASLPLALSAAPGFELRRPLGIAIIGGLLLSQLVTLYTTPAVYLLFDTVRSRRPKAAILPRPL